MAKLTELKRSAELTIRKTLDNEDFLIWCNELYGELSEIAKQEEVPLEFTIDGSTYDFDIEVEGKTETLTVSEETVTIPSNFQQIIKVEALASERKYLFYQRSFGDDEITTKQRYANHANLPYSNKSHLYFFDYTRDIIVFKSSLLGDGNALDMSVYYYKTLPLYDVETDKSQIGSLTIPFDKNYHKIITYYVIMKYYETWQDPENKMLYMQDYLRIRTEYESAVLRRHQENEPSEQLKEAYWI